jgi:molybdenum cofactor biosynthesis enzyme MoaA
MTRGQVQQALRDSTALGVKEYYFTGGEPFMHRDIVSIVRDALAYGPVTALTNATLLPERRVAALARVAAASSYSLELRVSLDGVTAEHNDAIRGTGTFARTLEGVQRLVSAGFLPIVSAMQSWPDAEHERTLERFRDILAGVGYTRARLKIMPPLLIGAEAGRNRAYEPAERVTHEMLQGYDLDQLLCTRGRLATARGVYSCPILPDFESARLGDTLAEAVARPAALGEQACFTCYVSGTICANVPTGGMDA